MKVAVILSYEPDISKLPDWFTMEKVSDGSNGVTLDFCITHVRDKRKRIPGGVTYIHFPAIGKVVHTRCSHTDVFCKRTGVLNCLRNAVNQFLPPVDKSREACLSQFQIYKDEDAIQKGKRIKFTGYVLHFNAWSPEEQKSFNYTPLWWHDPEVARIEKDEEDPIAEIPNPKDEDECLTKTTSAVGPAEASS